MGSMDSRERRTPDTEVGWLNQYVQWSIRSFAVSARRSWLIAGQPGQHTLVGFARLPDNMTATPSFSDKAAQRWIFRPFSFHHAVLQCIAVSTP